MHLVHTVLSGAIRYAERLDVVGANPVALVIPSSFENAEVIPPDVAGVRRMLEVAREKDDSLTPCCT